MAVALTRIEEGFKKLRTREDQRENTTRALGTRLQNKFQEIRVKQSQLNNDIKETREETKRIDEKVQVLWHRPVVTAERLHPILDDLRRTQTELEQRVGQAEIKTQSDVNNICGDLQDLTKAFDAFEDQVSGQKQVQPSGQDHDLHREVAQQSQRGRVWYHQQALTVH